MRGPAFGLPLHRDSSLILFPSAGLNSKHVPIRRLAGLVQRYTSEPTLGASNRRRELEIDGGFF